MREAADAVVDAARRIHAAGLTHGTTGNVSVRVPGGFLITPTGGSLATVRHDALSHIDLAGGHLGGSAPSKEAFLHAAMLRARPHDRVVLHTHSVYSTALSCRAELNDSDAIPALTAYFAMRIRRVIALPYHAPGDAALGGIAEACARESPALLLRNHGPIVSAPDVADAFEMLHELEVTSRLTLLLGDLPASPLSEDERNRLHVSARARKE